MKILPSELLQSLNSVLNQRFGLNYPAERWRELQKNLMAAANEAGLPEDPDFLLQALEKNILSQDDTDIFIRYFTVGETYFFREKPALEAFRNNILPAIIHERKGKDQSIRIWSAGCCTGEEPYSIALLMKTSMPDIQDWNISILGTDLNRKFLEKAISGKYSKWSFRETPPEFLPIYFKRSDRDYQISEEIQKMVKFDYLNLVSDIFPSPSSPYHNIDILFCRNVLMYFAPEQAIRIGQKFFHTIAEGGWLITSPVEVSNLYFEPFKQVNFQDAIVYQKISEKKPNLQLTTSASPQFSTSHTPSVRDRKKNRVLQKSEHPQPLKPTEQKTPPSPLETAKSFANHGKLKEARLCLEPLIDTEPMNTKALYFYAHMLMESDELQLAENMLKRLIYLEPDHIMAHYQMGNLARLKNQQKMAVRHFRNVIEILKSMPNEEIVNDSEGITAGRMIDFCNLLIKN